MSVAVVSTAGASEGFAASADACDAAHPDEAPKSYRRELHLAGLFPVFFHPRLLDIAEYCCYDVKATKLVHEYGASQGKVYYLNDRTKRREAIPVPWKI